MSAPIEHDIASAEWPPMPVPGMIEDILEIISGATKIDRSALQPGATMQSLNIASLDMVEILFELEERFQVYIAMGEELTAAVYLRDLVQILADEMQRTAAVPEMQP